MGISVEEYKKMVGGQPKRGKKNPNPNRQYQGKVNRELGKVFEEQVETICKIYEMNKLARIEKTPEPMKILKHIEDGRFETVFEKSAQPDFKGTVKGGRSVVFDAKFTESDRIRYQALSDYQRETLLKYNELGAMAFVLVGFSNGRIYRIDINDWNNMKENFGRFYIKQKELEDLNLGTITNSKGITDFLNIL